MDDDECPDSTVMMDDEEMDDDVVDVPFSHRRSFDEPQSNRISSTAAMQFPVNFQMPQQQQQQQQLPPLPKLIFRPPTAVGNFPSVSFASQQSGLTSRLGTTSTARGDNLGAPRLSPFPSARSESFPGTRVGGSQSQRDIQLPRLEPMSLSRSELTISRVSSTPSPRIGGGRICVSSSSQNEFARVGGVSISRVVENPPSLSRISSGSPAKRIVIPPLKRIGGGGSSQAQQADTGESSRKFGRRFLKSSPAAANKPQLQGVSRVPMTMMRASSTDEYFPMGQGSTVQAHDSLPVDSDAAVDYIQSIQRRPTYPTSSTSTTASTSRKSQLTSETLTSQHGSQGIKLHIHKRPVGFIEVDDSSSEKSSNSLVSTLLNNSDNNMGASLDFMRPNISANNSSSGLSNEEVSVKPVSSKSPKVKELLKIPSDLIIDEVADNDDDSKKGTLVSDIDIVEEIHNVGPRFAGMIEKEAHRQVVEADNSSRRSGRKRQPVLSPNEVPPKIRKRRGGTPVGTVSVTPPGNVDSVGTPNVATPDGTPSTGTPNVGTPDGTPSAGTPDGTPNVSTSTKGKGTGRGRGRPKGSTNKAKLERLLLEKAAQERERQLQLGEQLEEAQDAETGQPKVEISDGSIVDQKKEEVHAKSEEKEVIHSVTVDTTSPVVQSTVSPTQLPLEGDPDVNAEVSSATTPTKKQRGRGRGSGTPRGVGSPRGSRANRGARGAKSPKGEKKTPEGKKAKQEKKEAIKAPPPVQVFEEETRMSADIKPPIPERINALVTPVVLDEESRASNVSSTSTSTTAKAKRFTKDPIEERKPVTAETLYEYQWPLTDKNAEFYFLQEQISEYLGVKSFKRKYPEIRRRVVDMEERDFLRDTKVVSETQCDLGLTAVHSCDILDIMFNDYPEKYEEYRKIFQARKDQEMAKLKPQSGEEAPAVRDRSAEFMRRILKSCAKWNLDNNRDRKEERPCAFDLQTGTLHYPKNRLKVLEPEATKLGKFPVAVLPGQFTDNYKVYSPDELSYLPLNTVRYGPVSENWIVDSDSSDESSDSDDSSSSNDSSSCSSDDEDGSIGDNEQNYITLSDESGNLLYRGLPGLTKVSVDAKCKSCEGTAFKNKDGNPEVLLHCSRCDVANHPTCLELTVDMLPFITKYHWECTDCKNCIECNDPADEDKMLFCDCCDRGYHIYCVGLRKVPTGRWHCSVCAVCYSCGVTQPSPEDRMAEWHHEFRKGEKGAKFYLHSFCVACHKLFKKGQFCPSCLKVHSKLDKDLLECRKCEKWVHRGCVKRPLKSMFGFMCDPCDANFRSRSKLPSHVN